VVRVRPSHTCRHARTSRRLTRWSLRRRHRIGPTGVSKGWRVRMSRASNLTATWQSVWRKSARKASCSWVSGRSSGWVVVVAAASAGRGEDTVGASWGVGGLCCLSLLPAGTGRSFTVLPAWAKR
jgi:hypothetical protein